MFSDSTPSTTSGPASAEAVADHTLGYQFVKAYYATLVDDTAHLFNYYDDDSEVMRVEDELAGAHQTYIGQLDIHEKVMSLNYAGGKVKIETTDTIAASNNGIVVLVTGVILLIGQVPRNFVQTFLLLPQTNDSGETRHYVRSDILRLTQALTVQQPATAPTNVKPTPSKSKGKQQHQQSAAAAANAASTASAQSTPANAAPAAAASTNASVAAPAAAATTAAATPAPAASNAAPAAAAPVSAQPTQSKPPRSSPNKQQAAKEQPAATETKPAESKPAAETKPVESKPTPSAAPAPAPVKPTAASTPASKPAPAAAPAQKSSWASRLAPAPSTVAAHPAPVASPPAQQQQAVKPVQPQAQQSAQPTPAAVEDDGFKTVGRSQEKKNQPRFQGKQGGQRGGKQA